MRYVTIEAKTQEFLWHGTNSKNLKSILSKGLTPDGKYRDVSYGDGRLKSIHGIYLATGLPNALHYAEIASKRTYNEVLVLVKASYDNENFALDEDVLKKYWFKNNGNTDKERFDFFVNYYLEKIKPNAHKSFVYTCNKNKKLIIDWINYDNLLNKDTINKGDERDRELTKKITLLLGKFLTSKIKKIDTYHREDENWKNVATNKPITYKGATRIISIWMTTNSDGTTRKFFVQIYGDKKYNKLLQQYCNHAYDYKLLDELHGMEDYNLYNDLLVDKKIDWNLYVKKHKKLPSWLNKYFMINPDLHSIPENFSAEKLYVNPNIKELPRGLKVDYLDLSLSDNIKRLPQDIQVKTLITNKVLENIPVDELEFLELRSHNCVEDAVDTKIKTLKLYFPISEFPLNLQKLDMSQCYESITLPKNMWDIECVFSEFQLILPDGFRTKSCDLHYCEYMSKLPNNLTTEYLWVPPKIQKLPENLTTDTLELHGNKNITEIPASAKIKELYIYNKMTFPNNFSCEKLQVYNISKDELDLSHCSIKEIVE